MKKTLILSITLLASFAGVHAMENEQNNNQQNQILNTMMGPLQIAQQFLIQQGMLPEDFITNQDNYSFGYTITKTTNNEGQTNTSVTVEFGLVGEELQTIDVSALWPQIQNLINQNQNNQE